MLYNALHHHVWRLLAAIAGELLIALSISFFVVPLGLYSGGIMGLCQLVRTLLQDYGGIRFGHTDIAGLLYFLVNLPILLLAYGMLGKSMAWKTLVCSLSYSLFYSLLPIPEVPVINDYLTSCLLGGILTGAGSGIILTCGCSSGGLDIIALCISKRRNSFTVGRFALVFNLFLYAVCLVLFSPAVVIYSVIYNYFASIAMDKLHQQSVSVQALIVTREDVSKLSDFIIQKLDRSVTRWQGVGAYTGDSVHVLCVCLSKYEIEELLHAVHSIDPHAFLTVQEGAHIYGNFHKKLE